MWDVEFFLISRVDCGANTGHLHLESGMCSGSALKAVASPSPVPAFTYLEPCEQVESWTSPKTPLNVLEQVENAAKIARAATKRASGDHRP